MIRRPASPVLAERRARRAHRAGPLVAALPGVQVLPHAPQFSRSVLVSTQTFPQTVASQVERIGGTNRFSAVR